MIAIEKATGASPAWEYGGLYSVPCASADSLPDLVIRLNHGIDELRIAARDYMLDVCTRAKANRKRGGGDKKLFYERAVSAKFEWRSMRTWHRFQFW